MPAKETWVHDTREKNAWLLRFGEAEGWTRARLTLGYFKVVGDGEKDFDCGDFTNENGDGIVEFKEIGDFVGTFGKGGMRGTEQVVKLASTGIPVAVIVHGSEYVFMKRSRVNSHAITNAKQKALSLSARYHVPFAWARDPAEAVELAKTFIRKAPEMPRGMPVWNEWKPRKEDTPLAMLCGIPGIGPEQARRVLQVYPSMGELCMAAELDEEAALKHLDTVYGIGPVIARRVIDGVKQTWSMKT